MSESDDECNNTFELKSMLPRRNVPGLQLHIEGFEVFPHRTVRVGECMAELTLFLVSTENQDSAWWLYADGTPIEQTPIAIWANNVSIADTILPRYL